MDKINISKTDKEIEDLLDADMQIMMDLKRRGLDVDEFFDNRNVEENKKRTINKFKIKYL